MNTHIQTWHISKREFTEKEPGKSNQPDKKTFIPPILRHIKRFGKK
jgi:hypothetical protein